MRRGQRCAVYVTDVCPPISFDDSNYTTGRLLRGTSRDSRTLLMQCLLFLNKHLIFPFVFGVFGVIVF